MIIIHTFLFTGLPLYLETWKKNLEFDNLGKKKNLEKPGIWEILQKKNLEKPGILNIFNMLSSKISIWHKKSII